MTNRAKILLSSAMSNTTYLMLGTLGHKFVMFILFLTIARKFGAENLGEFYFALTIINIFFVFSNFGFDTLTTRSVAQQQDSVADIYLPISIIKAGLSVLSILIIQLYLHFTHASIGTAQLLLGYSFILIFNTNLEFSYSILRGVNNLKSIAILMILNGLFTYIIAKLYLDRHHNPDHVLFIILASSVLVSTLAYIYVRKRYIFRINDFKLSQVKLYLKMGLPFIFAAYMGVLYSRIDVMMISLFKGFTEVGIYSAGYRIIEIVSILPGVVVAALFPILSSLYKKDVSGYIKSYNIIFDIMLLIGIPIAIILFKFSAQIVHLLYYAEFESSGQVVQALSIRTLSFFTNGILGSILFSSGLEKRYLLLVGLALSMNIVLNVPLIYLFSYTGAAIATSISALFAIILHAYFINRYLESVHLLKKLFHTCIVGLLSFALIEQMASNIYLIVCFSILVYLVMLYITGFISNNNIGLVIKSMKLVRKNK